MKRHQRQTRRQREEAQSWPEGIPPTPRPPFCPKGPVSQARAFLFHAESTGRSATIWSLDPARWRGGSAGAHSVTKKNPTGRRGLVHHGNLCTDGHKGASASESTGRANKRAAPAELHLSQTSTVLEPRQGTVRGAQARSNDLSLRRAKSILVIADQSQAPRVPEFL
jgi:hypothetical protein